MKISVHTIIDFILRCGDIDNRFYDSAAKFRGSAAHRKIQQETGANYKKEVSLKLETTIAEIPVLIQGRADGIITDPDGNITIDEIKTTTLPLDYIYNQHELHFGQAMCYAYMYIKNLEKPLESITVQLTYYQLDYDEIKKYHRHYTYPELESFFHDLLHKYGSWLRFEKSWKEKRNNSIASIEFPFESYRKGQREFAASVYRSIISGNNLYATAPTGVGKTISVLFPSIKAMGEEKAEKLFYFTAKTVTRTVPEEAISLMVSTGLNFKSVTLRAKDKMCPNEECYCNPDRCQRAQGHYDRINDAIWDLINKNDLITPAITMEYAQKHKICPHEFALDIALWSDLVIGDYNHIFDPSSYLRRFFDFIDDKKYIFLFDEAHNLADRVRDMYTVSMRKNAFTYVRKRLTDKDPHSAQVRKTLRQINAYFVDVRKENENNCAVPEQDFVFNALLILFSNAAGEWLLSKKSINHELYGAVTDLYFEINMYLMISELYDEHYTTLIEISEFDVIISLFCIDPSAVIKEGISRSISSVFFSATLTPLNYYREILGGNPEDKILSLPSPFDPKRLQIIIHRGISVKYTAREKSYVPAAKTIYTTVSSLKGNYLIFLPSYTYMQKIYTVFSENHPDIKTLLQTGDMPEEERAEFLERFRENNPETLAGFTVLGGIFSEGIDLKGDRLKGSIIISTGIPMINLRQDQILDYYNNKGIDGYDYAYVYPGMNKVLQAAGRVIRTETDSGIVLLIDNRFTTKKYLEMFPNHWSNLHIIDDSDELPALLDNNDLLRQ